MQGDCHKPSPSGRGQGEGCRPTTEIAALTPALSQREREVRHTRQPGDDRGFTLLEVLVAFIIAAIALTALFTGGLGGLRAADISARYAEAVSRAQSHLAAASVGEALTPGDRQGDEGGGFHWRVRISPVATTPRDLAAPQQRLLTLYAVSSAVSWRENDRTRTVQLDTERVAAAPPPPP